MSSVDIPDGEPNDKVAIELGTTGLRKDAGIITEEFLPQLQGRRGYQVYREMRDNEPTINGLMFAIEMSMRTAERHVRAADEADPQAQAVADFVDSCFDDMSASWEDTLVEILSMFTYGWSAHEIVYKRRNGHIPGQPGSSSNFDDGLIGWRKLPIRSQETLDNWDFDATGGIRAMMQTDAYGDRGGGEITIPIEKLLLFRTSIHKNNPEGRSVLRGAYRPWFYKRRIEELEAIGIERELAGMPVMHAPIEIFEAGASPENQALRANLLNTVRNIRRDQQDGLVMPLDYDEDGNLRYRFELMTTGGRRAIDTDTVLKRKMTEIALTVLADFILLGHEQVGSFALSRDKTNLFATALDAYLDSVADVFNRHAIPRLLRLNGIDTGLMPRVTFSPVRAPGLDEVSEYLEKLATAGMPLFPDEALEGWLREKAGLPSASEEEDMTIAESADRVLTSTPETPEDVLGMDREDEPPADVPDTPGDEGA